MKIFKFCLLFLLTNYYLILNTVPVSAHFVKSDSGIGAVLHVDPGDDPAAGGKSNIILEFKDTNNKFNLSNCECRIVIMKESEEILNQDLEPVAPDQDFSSVTPVIFPEKNIYKLKISGSSRDGSYNDFELNYDIRVARVETQGVAAIEQESDWWKDHIIHLVGGAVVAAFLIGGFFAQNKKKVAVIILVLFLLGHSIPVKAIHASHDGPINSESFACCLPTAAVIPLLPTSFEISEAPESSFLVEEIVNEISTPYNFFIRPPPPN